MATSQEAINRLTIQSTLVGEAEVTAGLKRISAAHDGVAVSSSSSERATVSLEKSFANIERRYVAGVAAQQQYDKIQRQVNDAVKQNPALQDRANVIMAAAKERHDQLTNSQKAMGVVTSDLTSRVQANAGAFGTAGVALSALGPIGIGVAAVLGAVYLAFNHMVSEADRMGDGAIALRTFSLTTDLSIAGLKALGRSGAEFGVGTDAIAASIDKLTVNMEEARKGTGTLYDAVRRIDVGLADELATTKTTAQAWDVLGKARAAASDQSKNALSKAAFGKGGIDTGLVLDVTAEAGGLEALVAKQQKLNGLTDDQIKKWAITKVQIDETEKRTANLMAATYTQAVLDRQLQAAQLEERITRAIIAGTAERQKSVAGQYDPLGNYTGGPTSTPVTPIDTARSTLAAGMNAGQKPDLSGYDALTKKLWDVAGAEKAETDERKEALDAANRSVNKMKEEIGVLGSAATIEDRRLLRLKELDVARLGNVGSEEQYKRAVAAVNLDAAIAKQSAYVGALGASAPISEMVRLKELELQKQRQQDPRITQAIIDQQKLLVASQQLGTFQIDAQTAAEKVKIDTILMTNQAAIAYTLVQTKINEAIAIGKPLTADQIAGLQKSADAFAKVKVQGDLYSDVVKLAQNSGAQFSTDLISGLGQGQTAVESLHNAFKNLASSLTSGALKSLFQGDFLMAGIQGIAAVTAAIFSANTSSSGDKWLAQQTEAMNSRLADISQRSSLVGVDTNTRQGAIVAQDAQFVQERIAENKAGGQAMNALLQVQVQERNQLLKDWDQKDTDLVKQNADAKLAIEKAAADRSLSFQDRLFAATNDFDTLQGQLAAFDRTAQQERITEVQNGGQAIVDLEAAQAAERYNVIKSFNDKTIASLNASAKSIVDFVSGLFAGPASPLSPTAQLAAEQLSYNTKLGLAQGGNTDALGSITTDAQNLLTAAKAVYASSAGYQSIFQNVTSQLLSLPAVQNTTDPTVQAMRDVLTAINIGNAALNIINATVGGTTSAVNDVAGVQSGMLLPAINAGNAVAVAANLASYFNNLAANTSATTGAINSSTGQIVPAVNAGNAANVAAALASYFNQIDPTGTLSSVVANTLYGAQQTDINRQYNQAYLPLVNQNAAATKGSVDSNNTLTGTGNTTLSAIQGLQNTANAQLVLMTSAFDVTNGRLGSTQNVYGNSSNVAQATSTTGAVVQNQMVQALNKIVWNTFVIANNTSLSVPQTGGSGPGHLFGTYATGGTIPAHGLGLVSEHLNPTWVRAGSEPITVSPFPAQSSFRAGNDNGSNAAILAELRASREELKAVRTELAEVKKTIAGGAAYVREGIDAVQHDTGDMKRAGNMRR